MEEELWICEKTEQIQMAGVCVGNRKAVRRFVRQEDKCRVWRRMEAELEKHKKRRSDDLEELVYRMKKNVELKSFVVFPS